MALHGGERCSSTIKVCFQWLKVVKTCIIYKDQTYFWMLKYAKNLHKSELFHDSLMGTKEWLSRGFYQRYNNLEQQGLNHRVWVLPFCCFDPACKEDRGFICTDPLTDPDLHLLNKYSHNLVFWSNQIYKALNYNIFLPQHGKQLVMGIKILKIWLHYSILISCNIK